MHAVDSTSGSAIVVLPGRYLCMLCVALLLMLSGCAATTTRASMSVKVDVLDKTKKFELVYVLQPGDQVEVFVYRHPELSRKPQVRPDGFISLPLLNDIQAAGKTPHELSAHVTKLLSERIRSPEVSVIVENAVEPMAFVLGDVGVPRSVSLRQAKTVAQALAQTSTTPRSAALSSVAIVRIGDQGLMEAHTVDVSGLNQPEVFMALNSMHLKANDLIVVPESYRSQFIRVFQDMLSITTPYYQLRILDREVGFGL